MTSPRSLPLVAALAAATLAACGSSAVPSGAAKMNVRLVDAPSPGYSEVNIDVQAVEIAGSDGWITLGTPNRIVNLLALTGGVSATLVEGATLRSGRYGQMRLILGPRNTVRLADGTVHELKVPSGQQTGVKLTVDFDVKPGTTADVYIDFDAHRSVFVHAAGNSGKYMLRPTVRACAKLETGSISGTLTDAGTNAVLPGAAITAQTLADGAPMVLRSVNADANGHYVLDLLPLGTPIYVVGQPVQPGAVESSGIAYAARASGPITLTAASPTATHDAAFSRAAATGGVAGTITPAAVQPEVDTVQARLVLDAGGTPHPFVVRSVGAEVGASGESYAMALLPAASGYALIAERRSVDATGAETIKTAGADAVTVAAGATTAVDLGF